MRCAEFEQRLNDVLDDRQQPMLDDSLVEHARQCDACAEQLSATELLLDGVRSLARARPRPSILASQVVSKLADTPAVAESSVIAAPHESLAGQRDSVQLTRVPAEEITSHLVELAQARQAESTSRRPAWSPAWLAVVGAAAAVLVAVPWLQSAWQPSTLSQQQPVMVERTGAPQPIDAVPPRAVVAAGDQRAPDQQSPDPHGGLLPNDEMMEPLPNEPIAWVGYHVADRMRPVASSMVSALNALKLRPRLWLDDDNHRRSSLLVPTLDRESIG